MRDAALPVWTALLPVLLQACTSREVTEIDLPIALVDAKSAVVVVESADAVRVSAVDLTNGDAPELPFLEQDPDLPMTISARFYRQTLAELEITREGPLPEGQGGTIPTASSGQRLDQSCVVRDDGECSWTEGAFGAKAATFTSPALPFDSRCRRFAEAATHAVGENAPETRANITQAARLGQDGVLLQGPTRLLRVNESGVRLLNTELDRFDELLAPPMQALVAVNEEVVIQTCAGGETGLVSLNEAEELSALSVAGLDRCPRAFSAFEGELYALMQDRVSIRRFDRATREWRPLTPFSKPVEADSFIAYREDELAAVGIVEAPGTPRGHSIFTSGEGGARGFRLDIPEGTEFVLATPALLDGAPYFALSEPSSGIHLVSGNATVGFRVVVQRGSQFLYALESFEGSVLGTGRFGPIVQFDPRPERETCDDSALVSSSTLYVLEGLGEGRFLMAGNTRIDPFTSILRDEAQRVTIARVLPR